MAQEMLDEDVLGRSAYRALMVVARAQHLLHELAKTAMDIDRGDGLKAAKAMEAHDGALTGVLRALEEADWITDDIVNEALQVADGTATAHVLELSKEDQAIVNAILVDQATPPDLNLYHIIKAMHQHITENY